MTPEAAARQNIDELLVENVPLEQSRARFNEPSPIPKGFGWDNLVNLDGDDFEIHFRPTAEERGFRTGTLGAIFRRQLTPRVHLNTLCL